MKKGVSLTTLVPYAFIALWLLVLVHTVTKIGGTYGLILNSNLVWVLTDLIATVLGIMVVRSYGSSSPLGRVALFMTLAVVADLIGGIILAVYEIVLGVVDPFPSIADPVFFFFYLFAIIGIVLTLYRLRAQIKRSHILLGFIGWLVIVSLTYVYSLREILLSSADVWTKYFSVQYPIGDMTILVLLFVLFATFQKGVFGSSWMAFMFGFLAYSVADFFLHARPVRQDVRDRPAQRHALARRAPVVGVRFLHAVVAERVSNARAQECERSVA